jgi:hypothetical protein
VPMDQMSHDFTFICTDLTTMRTGEYRITGRSVSDVHCDVVAAAGWTFRRELGRDEGTGEL